MSNADVGRAIYDAKEIIFREGYILGTKGTLAKVLEILSKEMSNLENKDLAIHYARLANKIMGAKYD
jgi:hypothetical protein